jgi:hypothetical protein
VSNRPDDVQGYEELAESEALFDEGDHVFVRTHPSVPQRPGIISWRRWECGNQCWGYSVAMIGGGGTMAVERSLSHA